MTTSLLARSRLQPFLSRKFLFERTSAWSICSRNMSAVSEVSGNPPLSPSPWLQRLLDQNPEAPRLYAWTPANLDSTFISKNEDFVRWRHTHTSQELEPGRRIYILGLGNLGRLFASGLAKHADKPPITLVVHRRELMEHWISCPGIEITRSGQVEKTVDYDIEWWTEDKPTLGPVREVSEIDNLIVATKASAALPQVDRLRRYLGKNSTVAFVQNGVNRLWPPSGHVYTHTRYPGGNGPNWIACITTHGVTTLGPFRSIHASRAFVTTGEVLLNPETAYAAEYLLEQLVTAPDLVCKRVSKRELWVLQLEKLVVNSIINPLTAILDCQNGDIFIERHDILSEIIDRLIQEASQTLQALIMHPSSTEILATQADVAGQSGTALIREELYARFSFPKLRAMVLDVGAKVRENTSSMLQDVRAGKPTEIRDFNGWLLDTAKLLDNDLKMKTHEGLVALVENVENRTGPIRRCDLNKFFPVPG